MKKLFSCYTVATVSVVGGGRALDRAYPSPQLSVLAGPGTELCRHIHPVMPSTGPCNTPSLGHQPQPIVITMKSGKICEFSDFCDSRKSYAKNEDSLQKSEF